MAQPKKVTQDIFLVGSDSLSGSGDCLVYAIGCGKNELCLIDAGTQNADQILENIKNTELKARTPTHLILTHCHFDHIGAAHQFKEKFPNLKIYAHDWDVSAIEGGHDSDRLTASSWYGADLKPVKVNYIIHKDEELLNIGGLKVLSIHIPGHTPGSIALLVENDGKKVLFGQDVHGPFMAEFNSNISDWAKSMKKLISFNADILCEGHFGVFEGKVKVKNFIEGHLRQQGY